MLTQKRLKEVLHYNPDTGIFTWKVKIRGNVNPGDLAGCCKTDASHTIMVDGTSHAATHLAWLYMYGVEPKRIWVLNGNVKDFAIKNLRVKKPKFKQYPLTQERLREILDYNPETGVFTWKINKGRGIKGIRAGTKHKEGYIIIKLNYKSYKAHRLAFLYMEGYMPENDVDHIDRNPSNNKWNNLREISKSCNMKNCKVSKNNISKITGVCFHKASNKWIAQICVDSKPVHLGCFETKIDAAKARWEAEEKYGYQNCLKESTAYLFLKEN